MSDNKGYLYILTNPSIHGQVKIGRTERHPEERRKEISAATGVSTPFELVYWKFFDDCHLAESTLHKRLEQEGYRVSNNREFFTINEEKAKKLIEELSLELTKSDQNPNKIVKEGIRWLYGNEGTLRNEKRALDYFEQAAALDYYLGYYWAGVACEKIALTVKRKTDQASWQQRALNHYQNAMKKSYYKAYARSSWLYRKFNQHNEANYTWSEFLSESSKLEKLDNETCKWIIKWADNWGNKNKDLPDSPIWKKHGKLLISLSDKKNAPKGFAKKNISKKTGSVDIINFAIALFIIFVFIGIYIYFFR